MKVLFINQYFYPDVAATAQFMTELAEDLSERGMDVDVLRGTASYDEVTNEDAPRKESFNDVNIYRSPAMNIDADNTLTHLLNYSTFNLTASLRSFGLDRYDVVVAFTTPPLIGLTGALLKRLRGSKFVQFVADLYPDVAVELGYLDEGSLVHHTANKATNYLFNRADSIVALGKKMESRIQDKASIDSSKIEIIHNWADEDNVFPVPDDQNWFLNEHGLRDKFVVQYSGHIGVGHDFSAIISAMKKLRDIDDLVFLIIGEGPKKEELEDAKKKHNLNNVKFLPYQDKGDLAYSLSAADVSLATLKHGLEGLMVPSKIYGMLASGRPAIFLGSEESELARIIDKGDCGYTMPATDGEKLTEVIEKLYSDKDLVGTLGENARAHFLDNFERKKITERYYDLLTRIA